MSGEGLAQFGALLVAEFCEERVTNDMVGGAEVVNALFLFRRLDYLCDHERYTGTGSEKIRAEPRESFHRGMQRHT